MALSGYTPLWIPWNQSPILRATHSTTPREKSLVSQADNLPSREWLLSGSDKARSKHRHHHGLHAPRWINDGDALRLSRSWNPHVSNADTKFDWRSLGRLAEQKIWPAGNIRHLRRHATNRFRHERGPRTRQARFRDLRASPASRHRLNG